MCLSAILVGRAPAPPAPRGPIRSLSRIRIDQCNPHTAGLIYNQTAAAQTSSIAAAPGLGRSLQHVALAPGLQSLSQQRTADPRASSGRIVASAEPRDPARAAGFAPVSIAISRFQQRDVSYLLQRGQVETASRPLAASATSRAGLLHQTHAAALRTSGGSSAIITSRPYVIRFPQERRAAASCPMRSGNDP